MNIPKLLFIAILLTLLAAVSAVAQSYQAVDYGYQTTPTDVAMFTGDPNVGNDKSAGGQLEKWLVTNKNKVVIVHILQSGDAKNLVITVLYNKLPEGKPTVVVQGAEGPNNIQEYSEALDQIETFTERTSDLKAKVNAWLNENKGKITNVKFLPLISADPAGNLVTLTVTYVKIEESQKAPAPQEKDEKKK